MVVNPLQSLHEQAEAAFLPYGPEVQIVESYGEVEAEYAAIRKAAALMDAPHRGVAILTGKDRLSFLHNKVTNDTNRLTPGQGCYAYLLNLKGRIVADMNILQAEEAALIEMDARLINEFVGAAEKYIFTEDVRVLSGEQQLARLTVLGPRAAQLLRRAMDAGVETLNEPFRHAKRLIGKTTVTVFRNDLAGEPQYELIVPRDQLVPLWQVLHEAGHTEENGGGGEEIPHLRAIGWSAFNTARIEAGTPWYGIDITDNYLPMETAHWYGRAVCVTKGCYLGQEIVARMHAHNTVARLLVGLRVEGSKLPVAGTEIFEGAAGAASAGQIGIITSSTMSPMLGNAAVAMGYVKKAFAVAGREVAVLAEGSRERAIVTALPFWRK
ncbi:MAG TPA: glycine cleavage T C-terminal barrel domain-containing protein [Phycisphaerae bacterium]|nr:glycine cleavage T C-terminal barrel domain-containing protein [Phycisphaerae bacterium]